MRTASRIEKQSTSRALAAALIISHAALLAPKASAESSADRLRSIAPSAARTDAAALRTQAASGNSRLQSIAPMLAQAGKVPIPPQQRPTIPQLGPGGATMRPQGTGASPGNAQMSGPQRPPLGSGTLPGKPKLPSGAPQPPGGAPGAPGFPGGPGAVPGMTAAKANAGTDDEPDLQLPNASMADILFEYEKLTGKKIIRDVNVEGATMSIETNGPMPKADAIEFIEKTLMLNGYAFVDSGPKFKKLVAFDAKKPSMEGGVGIFKDEKELPQTDAVVNYVQNLTYIEPEDAAKTLAELIPPHSYGKIAAVPNTRAIVITENSATVRSLVDMLKILDAAPSATTQKTFQLKRENAEDVKKALDEILDTDNKKSGSSSGGAYSGATARPSSPPMPGSPVPGQPNPAVAAVQKGGAVVGSAGGAAGGSSASVAPKIIAIPRTNSLLVIARPVDMTTISGLVETLDAAADIQNFIIRPLKFLSAVDALTVLEQAISRGNDKAGASGGARSSPATSSGTNTNQTTSNYARNGLGGGGFGGSTFGGGGFGSTGYGGSGGYGGMGGGGFGGGMSSMGGGGNLQQLRQEQGPQALVVGKTLLIADSSQNQIFASGPPEHLRVMGEVLDELDQRPKQIMISAVIGEVTLADDIEFGLDWLLRPTKFRWSDNTGTAAGTLRNTAASVLDPNTVKDLTELSKLGNGLTLYGQINDSVNVIVNALASNTAFKVISRPTVFTLNNKPASIASGTSIPVPTQTFSGYAGTGTNNTGITSNIQYQEIALSLDVVPLINSEDELTLQISQQNNEQSGTTTINGNPYPTISQQRVNTMVMVKNMSTVLLGGLIRENVQKENSGIPILNRIPIIKYLAGSKKDKKTRRELLVFIQPRIVSGNGDLPPNVHDNAGQTPFANETRAFLQQEQSAPTPPVKTTRLGRLIEKLLY